MFNQNHLKTFFSILLVSLLLIGIFFFLFLSSDSFLNKKNENGQIQIISEPTQAPVQQEILVGNEFIGLKKPFIITLLTAIENSNKIILPVRPSGESKIAFYNLSLDKNNRIFFSISQPKNKTIYTPTNNIFLVKKTDASDNWAGIVMKSNAQVLFKLSDPKAFTLNQAFKAKNLGFPVYNSLPEFTPDDRKIHKAMGIDGKKGMYVFIMYDVPPDLNINRVSQEEFYRDLIFLRYKNRYVFLAE